MVGVVELESTTSTMSTWRSNQLSYTPILLQKEDSIYYTTDSRKVKPEFRKMRKKPDENRTLTIVLRFEIRKKGNRTENAMVKKVACPARFHKVTERILYVQVHEISAVRPACSNCRNREDGECGRTKGQKKASSTVSDKKS